jgi:flagellar basal-body rod protein FlgF
MCFELGMYFGIYQGASALGGLEHYQGIVAQNIANASLAGYKQTGVAFKAERMSGAISTGDQEGGFRTQLVNSMLKAESVTAHRQGQILQSGSATDLALDGDGFFEIEQGDGSILYTRDGQFHVNADNQLVNKAGERVQSDGGNLTFNPANGEIQVDQQGRIFQGGNPVGRIAVTRFENPESLNRVPGGFKVPEDVDPGGERVEDVRVLQGYYEASNVDPVLEMVKMIELSRAYEANTKVISTFDQSLQRATQTLGT